MSNTKGSHSYSEEDIQSWGVNDVAQWLVSLKLDSCVNDFMSAHIDGQRLLLLTWEEFKTLQSLKDDKKKKLLKKGLSQLPGRSAAEGKAKGKKFGRGKKSKQKNVLPSHPPPATAYPPQQASYNDAEVPALPPRPAKLGQSSYPSQFQPQPLSHGPQPPILRPPINNVSSYQDTGYGDESDDIYDAVPDVDIELEESEEIYDGEDSFSEDDDIEEEYEESSTVQQRHSELFALQARLVAHGIGNLEQGGMKPNQYNDEEDDGEIYDIPPDMEPSPGFFQQQGFGGYPQPPPPPGAPPPPPPGAPPPDDFESDDIYDLPPEQDGGHSYPQIQPPIDEFGYGIDEEIYDIADEELPQLQPPQSMPQPPQSMPQPPRSMPQPPQSVPQPLQGISKPPMRPPLPLEDPEDDEIYDCMEDIELIEEEPQPMSQPHIGIGMRPQMRPPILQQSTPPTNSVPSLPMRPPINQPSGALDVQKSKLDSFANQPCPPRPSSNTKPSYSQQTAQEKVKAVANQPPPPRPSSSSKPQAPPPAPPSPSQLSDKEEEDNSGGLASQLAAMKKRLRSGSNVSPSVSPPTTHKNTSPSNTSKSKPFSPQPSSSTSGGNLASSIAKARQNLRAGSSSTSPPKSLEEEKLSPKPSNLPPKRDSVESSNKLTTPPHSPKPSKTTKPSFPNKPALLKKPPVAPKSNKIANLMKSFQTQEDQASHLTPLPLSSPERKPIKIDCSPMTGRKLERDQSVKELTQRYHSPEREESSNRSSSPLSPQPDPSSAGSLVDPNMGNAAINKFRRKQLEIEEEKAPPRPLPINSSKVAAKPGPKPPLEIPPSEESKPPLLPKREELPSKPLISSSHPIPSPISNSSPPPLPKRPLPTIPPSDNEPLPPPIKETPRLSLPFSLSEEMPPSLPSRPPLIPNSNQPPLPSRPGNMRLPPPINDIAPPLPNRPLPGRSNLEPQQPLKPPLPPPVESQASEPPRPMKASQTGLPVGQSWYHAGLDRKNAEVKIRKYQKDGTFIVRDNTKNPGEYSLSLWFEGGVRHLRIRKRADNKFVLGEEKADEMPFVTVIELINYYKTEPVVLKSGGQTPLKYECPC